MPAKIDITGQIFGRLIVLKQIDPHIFPTGRQGIKYLCQCDCGNQLGVRADSLRSGKTKSCGCLHSENVKRVNLKHGHAKKGGTSPTWYSWAGMIARCENPNHNRYGDYGGRGITVCERWLGGHGFENFLADMGERPDGMTLDRENNNGNYEPGNCRWASIYHQNNNSRKNVLLWDGEKLITMSQFARKFPVGYSTLKKAKTAGYLDTLVSKYVQGGDRTCKP